MRSPPAAVTTPSPAPTPKPTVATIKPSFFGSGVQVSTYKVKLDPTLSEIEASISKNGPYVRWGKGTAGP